MIKDDRIHSRRFGLLVAVLIALVGMSLACGAKVNPTPTPLPKLPTATAVLTAPTAAATAKPVATPTVAPNVTQKIQYGGTLRTVQVLGMKSLDPLRIVDWTERLTSYLLYDSVVETNENFEIIPSLASSWDFSADGKTITFHLQKGVKFHDGTDFNSQAVKWVLEKIMDPDFGARLKNNFKPYVERIEAPDSETVTLRLVNPYRPLLGHMALADFRIISPTAWNKYGVDGFGKNPTGTGSFRLQKWEPASSLVVVRNDGYWEKGKPYLDAVAFQNVADKGVQLAMLRTGETDFIQMIDPSQVALLKNNPNVVVEPRVTKRWWSFLINTKADPFTSKAIRQAVAYSLDRKTLVDIWLDGWGEPAYMAGVGWYDDPNYRIYEFDLAKAKQKLTESGNPNGFSFVYSCEANDVEVRLCELTQAMLAKVGIQAKISLVPSSDYWADVSKGKFNFAELRYVPRPDPDFVLRDILHSKGGYTKVTGYSNPEVDKLIDEAAGTYDVAKSGPMYIKAQKMLFEDVPYVTLFNNSQIAAMSGKVKGFRWIPDTFTRYRDFRLEK